MQRMPDFVLLSVALAIQTAETVAATNEILRLVDALEYDLNWRDLGLAQYLVNILVAE
jgi:hypothetical protein